MISGVWHWLGSLRASFWRWVERRDIQRLREEADLCDDLAAQMLTVDHEYIRNRWQACGLRQQADERERAL